jgi:hypothetical protein
MSGPEIFGGGGRRSRTTSRRIKLINYREVESESEDEDMSRLPSRELLHGDKDDTPGRKEVDQKFPHGILAVTRRSKTCARVKRRKIVDEGKRRRPDGISFRSWIRSQFEFGSRVRSFEATQENVEVLSQKTEEEEIILLGIPGRDSEAEVDVPEEVSVLRAETDEALCKSVTVSVDRLRIGSLKPMDIVAVVREQEEGWRITMASLLYGKLVPRQRGEGVAPDRILDLTYGMYEEGEKMEVKLGVPIKHVEEEILENVEVVKIEVPKGGQDRPKGVKKKSKRGSVEGQGQVVDRREGGLKVEDWARVSLSSDWSNIQEKVVAPADH